MILKKCTKMIFLLIGILCFVSPAQAVEKNIQKTVLDNGLIVLINEMPASSVVSIYMLVKTGSVMEGDLLGSGISHFLEHMMFKGTETRGVGEIPAQIKALGGQVNASTGKDYTIYTITVPAEKFASALDIIADMMMNAKISPEEFVKERDVILNEMRLHEDNPDRRLSDDLYKTVYLRHPYRHPVIGYEELFKKITREQLYRYYKTRYVPNNMVLSIAGNIEAQAILPEVKSKFDGFQRGEEVLRNLVSEPQQISPRHFEESYDTDLARLAVTYNGVSLLDEDLYALDVLAKILGAGESSRLFRDIYKDKKLVYQISSYNYTPVDRGFFEIGALLDYSNLDKVLSRVKSDIKEIQKKGVTPAELEKAKRQVLSESIFDRQTTSGMAYSQALDEAFAGDYNFSQRYVDLVSKVTNEQIKDVSRRYLKDSFQSVVVIRPKAEKEALEQEKQISQGEIKKVVLDNGLTVLLRKDQTLPLVSLRLVMRGGTREDPENLDGLSNLTGYLWTRGTKKLSADQIDEKTESLGMSLDFFSGKNSLGLNLDFLAQDFNSALSLFADIIRNPSFPDDEIIKAKKFMSASILEKQDSIFQMTSMQLKDDLFPGHPFSREIEGTVESLKRIDRKDIVMFYQKYAVPNNMVLSVFGDIDPDKVLKQIKDEYGNLKKHKVDFLKYTLAQVDLPIENNMSMEKQQAMVMIGFKGTTLDAPDRYSLEVLTSLLGSSFNGRLFESIREHMGQAYSLGGASIPGINTGFVYFYALTSKDKALEVEGLLKEQITRLKDDPPTDKELNDIKQYLKGQYLIGLQTNSALSFTSSLDELYGLGYDNYRDYSARIDSVSNKDVLAAARKYLDVDHAAVVLTNAVTEKP